MSTCSHENYPHPRCFITENSTWLILQGWQSTPIGCGDMEGFIITRFLHLNLKLSSCFQGSSLATFSLDCARLRRDGRFLSSTVVLTMLPGFSVPELANWLSRDGRGIHHRQTPSHKVEALIMLPGFQSSRVSLDCDDRFWRDKDFYNIVMEEAGMCKVELRSGKLQCNAMAMSTS